MAPTARSPADMNVMCGYEICSSGPVTDNGIMDARGASIGKYLRDGQHSKLPSGAIDIRRKVWNLGRTDEQTVQRTDAFAEVHLLVIT